MTAAASRQETATRGGSAGDARLSLLLLAGLGLAIASLHTVLEGIGWWFLTFLMMTLVFASAGFARALLRRAWAPTLVAAGIGTAAITLFFTPETAFLGMIPTVDTVLRFGELGALGIASIEGQTLPADATTGILFLLCWLMGSIALFMDAVAIWKRSPALAGIPMLIVISVPSVVLSELADPFLFALTAIAYLLLLRPTVRRMQSGAAVGLGAIGVVGALVLPLILPPVTPAAGPASNLLSARLNPILDLGKDLRRPEPTLALTYMTSSATGHYLRLTTLEDFKGKEWHPVSIAEIPGNRVSAIGKAAGLSEEVDTLEVTTTIRIANTVGRWLPVPYPSTSITGLEGDWFWEPDGLSVRAESSNIRGQTYEVKSLRLRPTEEQMRDAPSSVNTRLVQLPEETDPAIADIASTVVGASATNYEKAMALQRWFRGGTFTYSEQAPVREEFDGSGLDVIMPFLEARSGYCVHFASAMAVMARTLGIPSRIVVGFLPGSAATLSGSNLVEYSVSSSDLHAWPELYFEGVGWVPFEPTPGRGIASSFPSEASGAVTGPDGNNPREQPVTDRDLDGADGAPIPTTEPTTPPLAGGIDPAVAPQWTAVSLLGLLLVFLIPALVRLGIRSRRFAAVHRGESSASVAWREVIDTARDLGFDVAPGTTARQVEHELIQHAGLPGDALLALRRLRSAVEHEAYAGDISPPDSAESETRSLWILVNALIRSASLRNRMRATLAPPTLIERVKAREVRPAS